ncbi:ABC transporter permease [uncultured Ruegeria sp.]|uniref:ABC transporter permease n=1 Tax=uncultured Ruegeria sp. TaxID=259304 RepID=UPI002623B358|nr:ABC transporter permease [uncultured Ruegeria sp.]
MSASQIQVRVLLSIVIALCLGGVLIVIDGHNPLAAYAALLNESFLDYWGLSNTLVKASPMLLAGLAVILPLRAGVFNIGGEGQIYMGGLFGAVVALNIPDTPGVLGLIAIFGAAAVGGGLWAAFPAYLRAYKGTNEVIVTLLMNFVAIHIVSYAVSGPLMAEGAPYPYSEEIADQFKLPILMPRSDAHLGILIGVLAAVLLYFWIRSTPSGFRLDLVGRNARAATYAGVNAKRNIMMSMIVGGALAGLAGAIEVAGLKYRLFHLFSDGYGYDGIVVAFLAALNPIVAPVAAFFLAGLSAGAGTMQRSIGVEGSVVEAIEGIIVICVAAALVVRKPTADSGWLKRLLPQRNKNAGGV